jgi:hypothetical protein
MTIDSSMRSARSERAACEHMHDTTSRYDPIGELLTGSDSQRDRRAA